MSSMTNDNKAKALQILEAFVACDETTLRSLIAEDSYEHQGEKTGPLGPESPIGTARWIASVFSDRRWDVQNVLADGDLVVIHANLRGRHTGDYIGIAPTGREVAIAQVHISRFMDGKVVEHWGFRDDAATLRQLNAPEPAVAGAP